MATTRISLLLWIGVVLVGLAVMLVRQGVLPPGAVGPLLEVVGFEHQPDYAGYTFTVTWEDEADWPALRHALGEVVGFTALIVDEDQAQVRWEGDPAVIGDDWQAHLGRLEQAAPPGARLDMRAVRFTTGRYTLDDDEDERAAAAGG